MSEALTFLNTVPDVTEAAEATTFRCIYRGVEVMVMLLDHGAGTGAKRYSVASFATENGLNNQGGDGADWRLQGPKRTAKAALALIEWGRFDVRIPDTEVYQSRPTVLPGETQPTRPHAHVRRVEVPSDMPPGSTMVEAHDLDHGGQVVFRGTAAGFDEQYELIA